MTQPLILFWLHLEFVSCQSENTAMGTGNIPYKMLLNMNLLFIKLLYKINITLATMLLVQNISAIVISYSEQQRLCDIAC